MLFNFKLTPLRDVVPWGVAGDSPTLHWFGLTDGQYWIDVGGQRLFEYNAAVRHAGDPACCAYQVARLVEDVNDMTPAVLKPVHADSAARISGSEGRIVDAPRRGLVAAERRAGR